MKMTPMTGEKTWYAATNQNQSDDDDEIMETIPDEPEQKMSFGDTLAELRRIHANTSVQSIPSSTHSMTSDSETQLEKKRLQKK